MMIQAIMFPCRPRVVVRRASSVSFEQDFLDPFAADPPHRDGEMWNLQGRARVGQIAEPIKNVTTDRVDAVGRQFEAEMFRQIVEPRVPADEKAAILERLDVKLGVAERRRVADDFLDDVVEGDNSLRPAKLVHHDREPLRLGEKTAEQLHRRHRLGDIRRGNERFGVMRRGIEQELLYVDNADDVVGRVGVDRDAAMAALLGKGRSLRR